MELSIAYFFENIELIEILIFAIFISIPACVIVAACCVCLMIAEIKETRKKYQGKNVPVNQDNDKAGGRQKNKIDFRNNLRAIHFGRYKRRRRQSVAFRK